MTDARYQQLLDDTNVEMTADEVAEGWHFCQDFDGLPVGPGSAEEEICTCPAGERLRSLRPVPPPELMLRSVLKHDIEQTFLLLSYPDNIRVLWRHVKDNRAEKAQLVTSVCADYTDGLLVTLELAFWMRQMVGHEWVPYNMQFRYEGSSAVLTSEPVDVGRFNSMRGLAPGQNALNAITRYGELLLINGHYGIHLPGDFLAADGRVTDVWIQVPRSLVLDRSRPRNSDPFRPV